ncbi:hypothetical protein [Nocardia niigatensis]
MQVEHSGHFIYGSGYRITLQLDLQWDSRSGDSAVQREREAAQHAVAAIAELSRELIDPLEFGLLKCVMHQVHGVWLVAEQPVPNCHWYLKSTWRAADPLYTHPVVIDAETVDESAMLMLVDSMFAEPCELGVDQWPSWDEMYVYTALARVPDAVAAEAGDYLVVDDIDNKQLDVRVPLNRRANGIWIGGHDLYRTPIRLHVYRNDGSGLSEGNSHYASLRLMILVNWSLWWENGSPGRAMLDEALAGLDRKGWYMREQ